MRPQDRERLLTEVRARVVAAHVAEGTRPIDEVLADSVYHERRRLKDAPDDATRRADLTFWSDVQARLGRAAERELAEQLGRVVDRYAGEVCGHFDERVYRLATRVLPTGLGLMLNAVSPGRLAARFPHPPDIGDAIVIQGATEQLRRLRERGTVILTPTHVSNMDSPVVGYVLYRLGMPPFVYGAGLNLFGNPLLGWFMHHLGAYTVDRRKSDPLYKEVLKTYAMLTMELGYDNLFFPGGTRSRSGAVERHLKLGLLGTGVAAYVNNLKARRPAPHVYIVPATLSYQLVLEAGTLIDDFLKEVGKARYIITDDEFSRPRTVLGFATRLLRLDSKIVVTVGRALDPFGNDVDDEGESLDPRGRRVDASRYVMAGGAPEHDEQRDQEYTREVAGRLEEAFLRENVVQSTNVVARALFMLLRRANPREDLVRLLRMGGRQDDVAARALYDETDRVLEALRARAAQGGVRLGDVVARTPGDSVVADALRHFAAYHDRPAAARRGDRVFAQDRMLLFYYQNRLEGYGLEDPGARPALAPDHRSLAA